MCGLACVRCPRYTQASSFFIYRVGLHVRRPRLHVHASLLFRMHHAELHVRRSRLHVRLAGLACVRLTHNTHGSICLRLPIHRAKLQVRCPKLHVRLANITCIQFTRYMHASICFSFAHSPHVRR